MVSVEQVEEMAMAYEEAIMAPHFHKVSFRVRKKIFATLDKAEQTVVVKLSQEDQDIYCSTPDQVIIPVPGAWGKKGWTLMKLKVIDFELLIAVLTSSYKTVAPKSLARKYESN